MSQLIFKKPLVTVGKRKQAIARVSLTQGKGTLIINNVSGQKYLQYNSVYLNKIWSPLEKLNLKKQFDITILVRGGGLTGQTEAIRLAITRQICEKDLSYRSILKPLGFLSRDARIKERKKYGLKKARKASQYSKR